MSKTVIPLIVLMFLSSCGKSDIESCVEAHLDAYDRGSREMSGEETRPDFKARLYLICGKVIGTKNIEME
jgi:hypothetical protein